jgi:hypothetical protein
MRVRHLNLTKPQHSHALQAPLAESAGGMGLCVDKDGKPVFAAKDDPDYQQILDALTKGVVVREQPGVKEILSRRRLRARAE